MKDIVLGYIGDNYVVAQWMPSRGGMQVIAIFRDLTDDGVTNFVVSQVTGIWNRYNTELDRIEFDSDYNDVFVESWQRALRINEDLNKERDIEWDGMECRY